MLQYNSVGISVLMYYLHLIQVSQTTSASGQLIFNIGSGVTIPSLAEIPTQQGTQEEKAPLPSTPGVVEDLESNASFTSEPRDVQHQPPAASPESREADRERTVTSESTTGHPDERISTPNDTASVGDLAVQLATLSARNLARGACTVASETYLAAQRVAELGLQQVNEQLQRRGIQFDDKEKENLKAILLMLLIVISAIFLLGLGKQNLSNQWEFYFTN